MPVREASGAGLRPGLQGCRESAGCERVQYLSVLVTGLSKRSCLTELAGASRAHSPHRQSAPPAGQGDTQTSTQYCHLKAGVNCPQSSVTDITWFVCPRNVMEGRERQCDTALPVRMSDVTTGCWPRAGAARETEHCHGELFFYIYFLSSHLLQTKTLT